MQLLALNSLETGLVYAVIGVAFAALIYAYLLSRQILAYDKGTPAMLQIWGDIKAGANAYLRTQLSRIIPMIIGLTVLMYFSVAIPAHLRSARILRKRPAVGGDVDRALTRRRVPARLDLFGSGWLYRHEHGR